ncbi:MAG: zinc-binding dehydrogenase, partial [Bacilli bacterium]
RIKLPLIVGHEFSGKIIACGSDVHTLHKGDRVSAESHITCGMCEFCLREEAHICENTKIIGVDTQGCFANYIKLPAKNCYRLPVGFDPLHLSVLEPLGNAVHTMMHFDIVNKDVAIIGCGPIGIMGVDIALALGAKKVFAIEIKEYRRKLAQAIGAHVIINPLEEDVITRVLQETNGKGVDVIGEFSGNVNAISQAFSYIKNGGGISLLGLPTSPLQLDLAHQVIYKGLSLYGVTGRRIPETWNQIMNLIDSNRLHLNQIITHQLPLREVNLAGELMKSGNCGKIILFPEEVIHE